jgi:acid phosphatase type 7
VILIHASGPSHFDTAIYIPSYANGAGHMWDAWFRMISPFAPRLPLMIAIGNHEYDHTVGGLGRDPSGVTTDHGFQPKWGNFADDSGGECGVPMAKRFRMPSSSPSSKIRSNGVFWYSYSFASVHTIVVSSEHDLSKGSDQHHFVEGDLKTVDRSVTPWVVVESHRPLYEGESGPHWQPQTSVGEAMRGELEDLLYDYSVDLVLAGHYHEYHRTCDRLYRGVCDSGGGPIHVTIGAAGAPLDSFYSASYDNVWTDRYLRGVYGYGRLTVANDTAMHVEFIRHGDKDDPLAGAVLDDVWILRDRSSNR